MDTNSRETDGPEDDATVEVPQNRAADTADPVVQDADVADTSEGRRSRVWRSLRGWRLRGRRARAADGGGVSHPEAATLSARKRLTAVGGLVVAAAALAASLVYTVHSYSTAVPLSASADRDSAVVAARSIGATMTTVKGGDPDGTLNAWRGAITGTLADQYKQQEAQLKQRIQQSSSSVSSTVTNAALSEFDHTAETAVALVFIDTTLTDPKAAPPSGTAAPAPSGQAAPSAQPTPSGQPAPSGQPSGNAPGTTAPQKQRLALTISLTRTDQGWKASDLKPADPAKAGQ